MGIERRRSRSSDTKRYLQTSRRDPLKLFTGHASLADARRQLVHPCRPFEQVLKRAGGGRPLSRTSLRTWQRALSPPDLGCPDVRGAIENSQLLCRCSSVWRGPQELLDSFLRPKLIPRRLGLRHDRRTGCLRHGRDVNGGATLSRNPGEERSLCCECRTLQVINPAPSFPGKLAS